MYPKNYYDIWCFDLATYFIEEHQYRMIGLVGHKNEIWLFNEENTETPLIMITPVSFHELSKESLNQRRTQLGELLQIPSQGVNISVVPSLNDSDEDNVVISLETKSKSSLFTTFEGLDQVIKPINKKRDRDFKRSTQTGKPKSNGFMQILTVIFMITFLGSELLYYMNIKQELINLLLGGFYKNLIVLNHEWYRMFTNGLVVPNLWSMILIILIFNQINIMMGTSVSNKKTALLYIGGVFFGSVATFITNNNIVMLGVINGILALYGYKVVQLIETRGYLQLSNLRKILLPLLPIMFCMVAPSNDLGANLFAITFGMIVGVLSSNRYSSKTLKKVVWVLSGITILVLGYLMYLRSNYLVGGNLYNEYFEFFNNLGG